LTADLQTLALASFIDLPIALPSPMISVTKTGGHHGQGGIGRYRPRYETFGDPADEAVLLINGWARR